MGRKKKETPNKVESSNISYSGDVRVTILKNGKPINKSKLYKNNGKLPLFKFLGYALAGRYQSADSIRPMYLRAFQAEDLIKGDAIPSDTKVMTEILTTKWLATEATIYKATPGVESILTDNKVEVTFEFLIPFTRIFRDKISVFALYSSPDDPLNDPSAYFILKIKKGDPDYDEGTLDIIEVDDSKGNFNLYLEWIMTIKNG